MLGKHKHIFGGALIVAGTAVGAGMLALPVVTGVGGFLPSILIYFLCWVFMTITGLFLLEVSLRMPEDSNIISMASHYLGRGGKVVAWLLYLFLFYSLSVAYISVGGPLLSEALYNWIPPWLGSFLFVAVLGTCVFFGAHIVDRVNLLLMAGLIVSYLFFMVIAMPKVNPHLLEHKSWGQAFLALPVIFTSFSYQGVVPSLTTYLKRNRRSLRIAIVSGTSLVFIIYFIWAFLILGIVPPFGEESLLTAKMQGQTAVEPLKYHIQNPLIYGLGKSFSFFAITTSFLGVTLGLFDFLADGLGIAKKGWNKLLIALITYLPSTLIAIVNPGTFLIALSYAGGIGCALLLGFLPTLMIWVICYVRREAIGSKLFPGGRVFLSILFLFVLFELVIEGIQEYTRLSS